MVLLVSLRRPSIDVTGKLLDAGRGPTYGGKITGTMVQIEGTSLIVLGIRSEPVTLLGERIRIVNCLLLF